MQQPSPEQLKDLIVNETLTINKNIVDHPAFSQLLKTLNTDTLLFNNVEIDPVDDTNDVIINGESAFSNYLLKESSLYIYKDESGQGYHFEWEGILASTSFKELYTLGIVVPTKLNLIDELSSGIFNEVKLLFTSYDSAFALEALSSGLNLEIPGIGISFNNIGFFYERSIDKNIDNTYKLFCNINIGTTKVPIVIRLPVGNMLDPVSWSLKIANSIVLNSGLEDIISLLSVNEIIKTTIGDNLVSVLPEAIKSIPKLIINNLNIVFDPQSRQLRLMNISLTSFVNYELVPGFIIQSIGVDIFATIRDKKSIGTFTLNLSGLYVFSDVAVAQLSILLPFNTQDDWEISMNGSLNFDKIQELERLPFIKLADLNLPPEWLEVHNVDMSDLKIIFSPNEKKIKSVKLAINLDAESTLIPGIKVKDPYLTFDLTF